jgi:single-strand DNA-binding protein
VVALRAPARTTRHEPVSLRPFRPAVQSSHVLLRLDVRKPEMVSGLRNRRTYTMTNIAILTGRIARDPDTRETKGGTNVTGITVVTDRPARDKDGKTYKDENGYTAKESEFHRVTCFNGLAKTVGQYCSKGQLVSVQGHIHYTQWEDKDGVTRYGTEILADKVDFLSRGNGSGDDNDNTDAPEID